MSVNSLSQTLGNRGDFHSGPCSFRSQHALNNPWWYLFPGVSPVFLHRAHGCHAARSLHPWIHPLQAVWTPRGCAALLVCQISSWAQLSWTPEGWKWWWVVCGSRSWTAHVDSCEHWLWGRTISLCLVPVLLAACHEIQRGSVNDAKNGDLQGVC